MNIKREFYENNLKQKKSSLNQLFHVNNCSQIYCFITLNIYRRRCNPENRLIHDVQNYSFINKLNSLNLLTL